MNRKNMWKCEEKKEKKNMQKWLWRGHCEGQNIILTKHFVHHILWDNSINIYIHLSVSALISLLKLVTF